MIKWLKDLFRTQFEHDDEKEPDGCKYCRSDNPEPLFDLKSNYYWTSTTRGCGVEQDTKLHRRVQTVLLLEAKQSEGKPKQLGNASLIIFDEIPDRQLRSIQAMHFSFCPVCGRKLIDIYDEDDPNYIGDSEEEQP